MNRIFELNQDSVNTLLEMKAIKENGNMLEGLYKTREEYEVEVPPGDYLVLGKPIREQPTRTDGIHSASEDLECPKRWISIYSWTKLPLKRSSIRQQLRVSQNLRRREDSSDVNPAVVRRESRS